MKTKPKTTTEKEPAKMKATWVLKRGCWESLFQRNKQTLGKGKARKRNIKETQNNNVFEKKGLMDKKQRKNGSLKGKTKGEPKKKTEQEEKKDFKDRPFGGTKLKNLSNCRKIAFLGLFTKTQAQQHRGKKAKPPQNKKKQTKKTALCMLGQKKTLFW